MEWTYLVYFLLGALLCFGAKLCPRGEWNEEYTSREQTKMLCGIMMLGVVFHHLGQKTCAPWISASLIHGLDFFINLGYLFVSVFLFCSGLGLYRSLHSKPDYLKGFFRRRILPVIIAFYLSEFIYTAVRLLMGQRMNTVEILGYLSGLCMSNTYSWYVIVIPFFYLAFWAAFRFCRREGVAIFLVFLFTLVYTVFGSLIDHQNVWWMRGEWWYNSILLFPLGLLFGRFEKPVTRFFRKGYWFWLLLTFAGVILLFMQSEWLNNHVWGYYGEYGDRLKVQHRLMSAGGQWLVCLVFVTFCFLLMMKVKLGNKALAWLSAMSLEFYLMHGLFVEMFGFNFLDAAKSIVRIKNVALYTAVVLVCSVAAALVFRWLCRTVYRLLTGKRKKNLPPQEGEGGGQVPEKVRRLQAKYQAQEVTGKVIKYVRYGAVPVLFAAVFAGLTMFSGGEAAHVVGGLRIAPPAGYIRTYTDSRYTKWTYNGEGKKPGVLILDGEIRGDHAQHFSSVDSVMEECSSWLTDMEIYVNPQGIRMVRGYASENSGYPDRRYYVESDSSVFLLTMIEDSRYYNVTDCEEAMQQTADGIRRL